LSIAWAIPGGRGVVHTPTARRRAVGVCTTPLPPGIAHAIDN